MRSIHNGALDRHEINASLLLYQWRRFVEHAARNGFLSKASDVLNCMEIEFKDAADRHQAQLARASRAQMDDLTDAQDWFRQNGQDYMVD